MISRACGNPVKNTRKESKNQILLVFLFVVCDGIILVEHSQRIQKNFSTSLFIASSLAWGQKHNVMQVIGLQEQVLW